MKEVFFIPLLMTLSAFVTAHPFTLCTDSKYDSGKDMNDQVAYHQSQKGTLQAKSLPLPVKLMQGKKPILDGDSITDADSKSVK